jgi:hypothetical protein
VHKVEKVMQHFIPKRLAHDPYFECVGMLQRIVGRCVLAGGQSEALYTPSTCQPCVYYNLVVEEEWETISVSRDDKGHTSRNVSIDFKVIFKEEHGQDFYLQDGDVKLYIPAGRRDQVYMERHVKNKNVIFTEGLSNDHCPNGIRNLLEARLTSEQLSIFHAHGSRGGEGSHKTGRYRFNEASYDVNEQVSALGLVQLCHDPYTGDKVAVLSPPRDEMLDADFFALHKWTKWDQKVWHECEHKPHVLLSDEERIMCDEYGKPIEVPQVPTSLLPQYMTAPVMTTQNFTPYTPPALVYIQPGAPTQMQPAAVAVMPQSDHPYHQAITANELHDTSGTVTEAYLQPQQPAEEKAAAAAGPTGSTTTPQPATAL